MDNDNERGGGLFDRFPSLKKVGLSRRRRIPYIQQLSDTECGCACLAMVLGYYGREIGLEEVRDVCGSSRDGMNALAVLNAANLLGLRGRGVKVEEQQFHMLEPCTVLHWEFQHFVVLEKMGTRFVEIVDPAYGRRRVPMEQFKKSFTGVALLFEPSEVFEKKKKKDVLWQTVKDVIGRTGLLPRIVVISLLVQVFGLAVPMLTGELIDRVLPRGDLYLLTVILVGLSILIVFNLLATMIRGHLLLHMRTVLDTKMTLGFLDHLVSLPYSYFQLRGAGDLMMRMNSNATVREVLTSTTLSAILDGLLVFVYLGILFIGNTTMALTVLLVAALDVITYLLIRRRQRELAGQNLQVQAKSQSFQVEMLTSMETLKATGNEHRAVGNWSNLFVDALNIDIERGRLSLKLDSFLGALRVAGPLAILAVGAIQVMHQEMTLGTMFSLNAVAGSFLMPLSGLVGTAMSMDMLRGYLARVNDVLEAQPEQNRARVKPAHKLAGQISLERVSFRYSPQGALVVEDVSIDIQPGQFVAIVGRSGAGKSTLANLLLGLYIPTAGRITFDGVDLAEMDLRSVRQQMGIVNQKLSLFGTTIRQNIALADPGLSLDEVVEAAKLACIHDDIMAMPLGYNTPLVDGGASVSGGQKQRLALARGLVRRPAILLLDEATSALDAVTERHVQDALANLACTRVVIAHRLSTIMNADLILVMDQGRVVESGDHEGLLAAGGFYAELIASQMSAESRRPRGSERSQSRILVEERYAEPPAPAPEPQAAEPEPQPVRQPVAARPPSPGLYVPPPPSVDLHAAVGGLGKRSMAQFTTGWDDDDGERDVDPWAGGRHNQRRAAPMPAKRPQPRPQPQPRAPEPKTREAKLPECRTVVAKNYPPPLPPDVTRSVRRPPAATPPPDPFHESAPIGKLDEDTDERDATTGMRRIFHELPTRAVSDETDDDMTRTNVRLPERRKQDDV